MSPRAQLYKPRQEGSSLPLQFTALLLELGRAEYANAFEVQNVPKVSAHAHFSVPRFFPPFLPSSFSPYLFLSSFISFSFLFSLLFFFFQKVHINRSQSLKETSIVDTSLQPDAVSPIPDGKHQPHFWPDSTDFWELCDVMEAFLT